MRRRHDRPPRATRAFLAALLPAGRRSEVLGDLDERYESRLRREGASAARRWYRTQGWRLAVWAVGRHMAQWDGRGGSMNGFVDRGIWSDLRLGWRGLLNNPGYAVVAVVTLGLGIGANTAVFSVVDGVLLRPLPFAEPGELVAIHETRVGRSWWSAAPVNAMAWRERSRTLEDVAWGQVRTMSLLPPSGQPETVRAVAASANLLELLGVSPLLGRGFRSGEDQPGGELAVILTHGTWLDRFGGDTGVIGRRIELDGLPHTVVGVLPEGREPLFFGEHDLLIPRIFTEAEIESRGRILRSVGRLAPDVDLEAAREEMAELGALLDSEAAADQARGWGVRLVPLKEQMVGTARTPLMVLLASVGFVLLVACANLSNLMLARGSARSGDLAIRASLGAGRGRLTRHLLGEAFLVAILGGALGLVLAAWGTELLLRIDPTVLPRLGEVEPDVRMLAFTAVGSILSAALFGFLPALRVSRVNLAAAFQSGGARGGSGRGEARAQAGLVAAEVSLVVLLLVGAGVMLRSLHALGAVDPGFEVEDRVALRFTLPAVRYADAAAQGRFAANLMTRARAIPGVQAAGMITTLPLSGGPGYTSLQIPRSRPAPEPGSEPIGGMEVVSPGYFEAMGIRLVAGRDFTDADGATTQPVAIVDQAVAVRFWSDADPLTDALQLAPSGAGAIAVWREIVGVVGAVRYGLDADPRPRLYLPEGQVPFSLGPRTLVARIEPGSIEGVVEGLRAAVTEVDPLLSIERIERLDEISRSSIARPRFQSALLTIFAFVALALGAVGVYGVVAYMVARRTREVGIRLALGASRSKVLRGVMREALMPVVVGLGLGLLIAAAFSRVLDSVVYGVTALDPVTFGAAPAVLLLVAAVAALLPGLRASLIDPVRALREE